MPTDTACTRCQTLPVISSSNGRILVSCDVIELAKKFLFYCKKATIDVLKEDDFTLWCSINSFEIFLIQLIKSSTFNEIEMKAITFLFLPHETPFSPSRIRDAKTIFQYKALLGSMDLSSILLKGALTTHFQPIIDIEQQSIYGYECLARGVEDDGTLIYPDKLFKWAREGDMLFYLDRACRESSLKTASARNIKTKIFINFIPTAIYDPVHCLASTVKWAKQLNFNPENIIFEVIESDHVVDINHLKIILDFYKSQGFQVALDDVGSGYSSLNLLAKLKPDIIKIDREIIDNIDTNTTHQSIFNAIVSLAKDNGILVLAEGLERAEEVNYAANNGAHLAQGYYFGKPTSEPIQKI